MKRMGAPIFEKGKRVWKWFDDYNYRSDDFWQIGQEFEGEGGVLKGKVARADCKVFGIKDGVNFARSWLVRHR